MAAILNFRNFRKIAKHKNAARYYGYPSKIFRKIAKHKNAYISKTVRAISTKFLTHRVSLQSSHAYF